MFDFFFLPQKLCLLYIKDVVRVRQTTDNIMQHRRDEICMSANWSKNTGTHSWYLILIAFLWQQWLWKHVSFLLYSTLPLLLPIYFFLLCIIVCRSTFLSLDYHSLPLHSIPDFCAVFIWTSISSVLPLGVLFHPFLLFLAVLRVFSHICCFCMVFT